MLGLCPKEQCLVGFSSRQHLLWCALLATCSVFWALWRWVYMKSVFDTWTYTPHLLDSLLCLSLSLQPIIHHVVLEPSGHILLTKRRVGTWEDKTPAVMLYLCGVLHPHWHGGLKVFLNTSVHVKQISWRFKLFSIFECYLLMLHARKIVSFNKSGRPNSQCTHMRAEVKGSIKTLQS